MENNTLSKPRSRAEILASLANIATAVQGKICEDRRTLANGITATYHNLQYWSDGKNHTIRIPEEKLGEFEEAVKNGRKAKDLLIELTRVDAESILSSASSLKKKSRKSHSKAR